MNLIKGRTVPEVWVKAARYLQDCKDHDDFDVILHVSHPTELSTEDSLIVDHVDNLLKNHGGGRIYTVAETIFPISDYVRGGREGVFQTYPERMKRIHACRRDKRWGCYAMRMLRQTDLDGTTFNPLEKIIEKMNAARKYKACYELVPGRPVLDEEDNAADVTTYDPATDRNPYYGNLPCLSLASFKYDKSTNQVRLNATYRSHYYMQRALGNLIGLGRLQYFVARESGADVGPLTINSTYAKLDTGKSGGGDGTWSRADISELIATCESLYESPGKLLVNA
ncbi:MAG: hypothetical protein ABJL57_01350 [Hyphomonas sp.]|uniref:hypothetical protein n=1 Tax=Hyphomonas sp. TaxID=87 RepID=UPI0032639A45